MHDSSNSFVPFQLQHFLAFPPRCPPSMAHFCHFPPSHLFYSCSLSGEKWGKANRTHRVWMLQCRKVCQIVKTTTTSYWTNNSKCFHWGLLPDVPFWFLGLLQSWNFSDSKTKPSCAANCKIKAEHAKTAVLLTWVRITLNLPEE